MEDQNTGIDTTELLLRIDDKVSKVNEKVQSIELIQFRIESDLKYHILRTNLLESQLKKVEEKVEPLHTMKQSVSGVGKIFAFIGGILTGIVAAWKAFKG